MTRYIVIVYPPQPATRSLPFSQTSQGWKTENGPKVTRTTSRSVEHALEQANVQPGGYAFVIKEADARRFDRAEKAPLIEKSPDGNPLAEALENVA